MSKEQERQPDFILHGMINLEKSVASEIVADSADPTKHPRRLIWGEITNSNADEDDERLISKSLDFSYFDDNGWIKYEHVLNDPARIIGCPHERVTTPEGATLIKGALFADGKYANDVWTLIQNIEAHNRQYPENQKALGWSIEGNYTDGKVTKGGYRKAKVINVVITPSPVNKSVYLHALQENHTAFAKSLNYGGTVEKAMTATPVSTDLAKKTGGDAITKENVDDEIKETAETLNRPAGSKDKPRKKKKPIEKSTIGSQSMKTFETVEQAKQHFVDEGNDEEFAEKLAKSLFPEPEADGSTGSRGEAADVQESVTMLKSIGKTLGEIKDRVFKSVGAGEAGTVDIEAADDFETLPSGEEGEEFFDAAPILISLQKGVTGLTQLVEQKVAYDHECNQAMAKALEGVAAMTDAQNVVIEKLRKSVTIIDGDKEIPLTSAVVAILKSRPGAPINLGELGVAPEGTGTGNAVGSMPEGVPNTWGDLQKSLIAGHDSGKITAKEMSLAENAWRGREFDTVKIILEKNKT